jgi:serine/threonine protein kinase
MLERKDGLLEPGGVLCDRYVIEAPVGRGGSSVVYRAHMPCAGMRLVAVKEISCHARTEWQLLARQAERLAALEHPALISVLDCFETDGHGYLVTSFVNGQTLEHLVESAGPVSLPLVIDVALQLCDGLRYLHSRRPALVFGDLSPSNLMLDVDGRIRLIDFGLSKTRLDGSGEAGRTRHYAAPEQGTCATLDERSDIYSMGATLYFMASGQAPVISDDKLRPASAWNVTVPRRLDLLLERMMSPQPARRPGRVDEVAGEFQEIKTAPSLMVDDRNIDGTLFISGLQLRIVQGADQGRALELQAPHIAIGRGNPTDSTPSRLNVLEHSVSEQQASLHWNSRRRAYEIIHQEVATNPTMVNQRSVRSALLRVDDTLQMGHLVAVVERLRRDPSADPSDTTGAWAPRMAFELVVLDGDARDVGRVFQLAEEAMVEGGRLDVGAAAAANDVGLQGLENPRVGAIVFRDGRFRWQPWQGVESRLNNRAIEAEVVLRHRDCLSAEGTVLGFYEADSLPPHTIVELLALPHRVLVKRMALTDATVRVGRDAGCDLVVGDDPNVSRQHVLIEPRGGRYWVRHLSRTNPTLVNGLPLAGPKIVSPGDEIQLSQTSLLRLTSH